MSILSEFVVELVISPIWELFGPRTARGTGLFCIAAGLASGPVLWLLLRAPDPSDWILACLLIPLAGAVLCAAAAVRAGAPRTLLLFAALVNAMALIVPFLLAADNAG